MSFSIRQADDGSIFRPNTNGRLSYHGLVMNFQEAEYLPLGLLRKKESVKFNPDTFCLEVVPNYAIIGGPMWNHGGSGINWESCVHVSDDISTSLSSCSNWVPEYSLGEYRGHQISMFTASGLTMFNGDVLFAVVIEKAYVLELFEKHKAVTDSPFMELIIEHNLHKKDSGVQHRWFSANVFDNVFSDFIDFNRCKLFMNTTISEWMISNSIRSKAFFDDLFMRAENQFLGSGGPAANVIKDDASNFFTSQLFADVDDVDTSFDPHAEILSVIRSELDEVVEEEVEEEQITFTIDDSSTQTTTTYEYNIDTSSNISSAFTEDTTAFIGETESITWSEPLVPEWEDEPSEQAGPG